MKLSILYTEEHIQETWKPFKTLGGLTSKAFGKLKRNPNVKNINIQRVIDTVFKELWADYHNNRQAQKRLEAYKVGSFRQHMPELNRIKDPQELYSKIKKIFKARAERVVYQQSHPESSMERLSLDPKWMTHSRT